MTMTPLNPGVLESLTTSSTLPQAVHSYEVTRLPRKDSPNTLAARTRDVAAIVPRLAAALETDDLRVGDLTTAALRSAFADFSLDHARSSIARCWSTWNGFCTFLVAEDVLSGNPMAGVHRPKPEQQGPKPLRGPDTPELLLGAVAAGRQARDPWPERDLAVVGTLLVTGIRTAELIGLRVGDLAGTPGDQRIRVLGKGNTQRSLPVEPVLADLVENYLTNRRHRFPRTRGLAQDAPLFVDGTNRELSRHQLQYLVAQCYRAAGIGDRVQRGALVHALRHTFATRVVAGGASAVEIMRLLGHRSLATSQQYVDAGADELRSAAAASSTYVALRTISSS